MDYDVAIVGGGMAGLTSAAYLTKYGYNIILLEQHHRVGGLINSFDYKGFTLDSGVRAVENSGIIFPMLKQLGIDIEFTRNVVSLVISDKVFYVNSKEDLPKYQEFLSDIFPESKEDVAKIIDEIQKVMDYMQVLYGIDNPLFVDYKNDFKYITKEILPWLFKYLTTIGKIEKLNEPIDEYLKRFTDNQQLIDIIAQHFFEKTPAFFALSYFSLYIDYCYPLGGMGVVPEKLSHYIIENNGTIRTNCKIQKVDLENNLLFDENGEAIKYQKLIWAADNNSLYKNIDTSLLKNIKTKNLIEKHRAIISDKTGGDSILTVYMTLDIDADEIKNLSSAHVFFTPKTIGLSNDNYIKIKEKIFGDGKFSDDKKEIFEWLAEYLNTTTFEISCPVIRDKSLAPEGKSGLIVSSLFDYGITKHIKKLGFYDEFKTFCEEKITQIIFDEYLKVERNKLIDTFSSTPLTIERYTSNLHGAITGWAFTNSPIPSVNKLSKIAKSIKTPLPNIYQAGQWSFSPSGLPISILTGKLAADKIDKELK